LPRRGSCRRSRPARRTPHRSPPVIRKS